MTTPKQVWDSCDLHVRSGLLGALKDKDHRWRGLANVAVRAKDLGLISSVHPKWGLTEKGLAASARH